MAASARRRTYPSEVQPGIAYPRAVVAGTIIAGVWVVKACRRFLRDLALAERGQGRWRFDADRAGRVIRLAGELRNIKGPEAGQAIVLLDWQVWIISAIYGFVERDTGIRRFRQASIWVPRGNGKSSLAAILALYTTFLEGEGGAEGYTGAVSRDQARIVFDVAKTMVQRDPDFRAEFGLLLRERTISQVRTGSRLMPISSDARALEGLNTYFAVLDEIASHRSKAVYDTMVTSMVKRRQPLMLMISTAGDNTTGIGKQLWDYGEKVLDGLTDDRFFAVMYAADRDDDPMLEATWIKANPGWPRLVQPEALRAEATKAQASPALKAAFLTRFLNIWVGADQALFDLTHWDRCGDPSMRLAEFRGQPCFAAIDMAWRSDLAGGSLVFPYEDDDGIVRYALFHKAWLPEAAVDPQRNPAYVEWVEQGLIEVTEGEVTSFEAIEEWLREIARGYDLRRCVYDPYALLQFSQRMQNDGFPMLEYRATTLNFSEPTKMLDALMREDRIAQDGSPVARWCIGNVVGHYDRRGNVYPTKARAEAKIDCAITDIMALGAILADEAETNYIYSGDRELLVF
jgi:phage terminase large subunit-like protein